MSESSEPLPPIDTEPFALHTCVRILDTSPDRVVVEQPPQRELDNHVGVRHASALHAAACEASRVLVEAALRQRALSASVHLAESDISYTSVGLGVLTTTAEPSGPGWGSLETELTSGSTLALNCEATTTNEQGKPVIKLKVSWALTPAA